MGSDCYVGVGASLTHAIIGNDVIIHPGVRIGQDGFGFAMGTTGHLKVPQIGCVIIGDDVEIGANSTIDRGALSDTIIGEGTKIDNLVQIAHNVVIGRHCVIVAQSGIAGSAQLGDFVVMGAHSGNRSRYGRQWRANSRGGARQGRRRGGRPHGWHAGAPVQGVGQGVGSAQAAGSPIDDWMGNRPMSGLTVKAIGLTVPPRLRAHSDELTE